MKNLFWILALVGAIALVGLCLRPMYQAMVKPNSKPDIHPAAKRVYDVGNTAFETVSGWFEGK